MTESIGKRIARLRQEHDWTQQSLAARLAISRVAISHFEMDLTIPNERTITLLAGLFKLTPHTLVDGTTYPQAKAERLPLVACCYTELEMDLALMENDLAWLDRLKDNPNPELYGERQRLRLVIFEKWNSKLLNRLNENIDAREREIIAQKHHQLLESQY